MYIAGPISRGDLAHNVNQATAAFVALARAGLAPLCPHWSVYAKTCGGRDQFNPTADEPYRWTRRADQCASIGTVTGNEDMTHTDWIEVDLPWVVASDAVLRLPGESTGADMETSCARDHGVPVFGSVAEVVAWATG